MYTLTITILCILSLIFIISDYKLYKDKAFLFWLVISCLVGWIEFVCFLRHDAWLFDPNHVLGIHIAGVTIEDILFCPCFSVIFWKLYHLTKRKFKQRVFNPTDKLAFAVVVCAIALAYFDLGSLFAKYMSLRTGLGLIGLVYCWNSASFRHSMLFLVVVYCIGFFWDLPSVANKIWYYPETSIIYDGIAFNILGAKFPIELFGYYFTGGFFSFWMIAFLKEYFRKAKRWDVV